MYTQVIKNQVIYEIEWNKIGDIKHRHFHDTIDKLIEPV